MRVHSTVYSTVHCDRCGVSGEQKQRQLRQQPEEVVHCRDKCAQQQVQREGQQDRTLRKRTCGTIIQTSHVAPARAKHSGQRQLWCDVVRVGAHGDVHERSDASQRHG